MELLNLRKIIINVIRETFDSSKVYSEEFLDEDYPASFDMDEFKNLTSFNQRIKYAEKHLQRISSGSARIVYKIDDEKALKLAKNKKGLAQNEVEITHSKYHDLENIVARVFDYHPNNLWVEMELATKMKKSDFKKIVGFSFDDYTKAIHNYYVENINRGQGIIYDVSKELVSEMWENEFIYEIFSYIGNYELPSGDLERTNSYGIVKRDGHDAIVLIDYGLTSDVNASHYARN